MKIRKLFTFNGMHIVRNCSSDRCKHSIHAHTYQVEIVFKGDKLDNGQMIYDFGLVKGPFKEFINSFNGISVWNKDKDFMNVLNPCFPSYTKVVYLPFSPSAENYALLFFKVFDKILKRTQFNNSEGKIELHSVRVHETLTGWAQAKRKDVKKMANYNLGDLAFNGNVIYDWEHLEPRFFENDDNSVIFVNGLVEKQV